MSSLADCLDKPKFGGANKRKQACVSKSKQLKQLKRLDGFDLPPLYRPLNTRDAAHTEMVPFVFVDGDTSEHHISIEMPYQELLCSTPPPQLIAYNVDVLEASSTVYNGRTLANCVIHIAAVPELTAAAGSVAQLLAASCVKDDCVFWRRRCTKESTLWPYLGNQLKLRSPLSHWCRGFENYALTSAKVRSPVHSAVWHLRPSRF